MARLINYAGLTADLAANGERISLAAQNTEPLKIDNLNDAYAEKIALLTPRKKEIKDDLRKLTGSNYTMNEQGKFSLFVVKTSFSAWNIQAEDIRHVTRGREITDGDVAEQRKVLESSGIQGEDITVDGKRQFVIDPAQANFFKKLKTALGTLEEKEPVSASARRRNAKEAGSQGSER